MSKLGVRLYGLSARRVVNAFRGWLLRQKAKRMADRPIPILSTGFQVRQDRQIEGLIGRVAGGEDLDRVVAGFDARRFGERVVEYPYVVEWLLSQPPGNDLLDVGCVLNKRLLSGVLGERCRAVWFCNPALEPPQLPGLPVFYHLSPLATAFPNGMRFPSVTCLSTLEHIGYDNSQYGDAAPARYSAPSTEPFRQSFSSLARLLAPGGSLLVSFPFGRREVLIHPRTAKISSQVMDRAAVEECLPVFEAEGVGVTVEVFAATASGWQRRGLERDDYRYADGCPAAAAVAFIRGKKDGIRGRKDG